MIESGKTENWLIVQRNIIITRKNLKYKHTYIHTDEAFFYGMWDKKYLSLPEELFW